MKRTIQHDEAEFKAKVSLEAIRGERTIFGTGDEVTKLHAKIGQLVVERDFLAKAFDR